MAKEWKAQRESRKITVTNSAGETVVLERRRRSLRTFIPFYVMLVIPVIWYLVFHYYPMTGLLIAFQKYSFRGGFYRNPWVGLRYFRDFLGDPVFWSLIRNTLVISVSKLIFTFPAPIILALMLNEVNVPWYKRTIQTVSYLPHFVSWAVVAALIHKFFGLYNGLFNDLRIANGEAPYFYLGDRNLFLPFVVLSDIWKGVGFGSIVYLAALSGVDPALYEAATIDGANGRQRMWHITLPSIAPTIGIMLLLNIGGLFGANMEQILLLQTPATFDISEVLDTYILKRGIMMNQPDYAAAVTIFRSTISLGLVAAVNTISKKLSGISLW